MATLTGLSEEAEDLRQNSPFVGVVSEKQREQALASFRSQWERRHPDAAAAVAEKSLARMNREQVADVLRAASQLVDDRPLVMGSQAILGTYEEDVLPPAATMSMDRSRIPQRPGSREG